MQMLIAREIRPRGGLDSLLALLHRHGLPLHEFAVPTPPPLRPAVRALRDHGLQDHAAAVLADAESLGAEELAIVRPYLREWLLALPSPGRWRSCCSCTPPGSTPRRCAAAPRSSTTWPRGSTTRRASRCSACSTPWSRCWTRPRGSPWPSACATASRGSTCPLGHG
ncbi:hypothetical protein [Nannocystis pusilla]|uniref:hypothetical protein n=1 Tax=Nannocystis pusilla TaxID=889268 RepID=UPI003B75E808